MAPTVAMQLRDIAGTLRAQIEEGEFEVCDHFVAVDMAALPAALERIAAQSEQAANLAA